MRSMLRHERQTVAMELASAGSAEYFDLTSDDGRPAGWGRGERPAALEEPRPQEGTRRHGGIGYELVLETAVPQLGAQEAECALPDFLEQKQEEKKAEEKRVFKKVEANIPLSSEERAVFRRAERAFLRRWAGLDEPSSSSRGKRRKKRKRREKKLPKTSSSSFFRGSCGGAGDQGIMHEDVDGETEDVTEYVQRADVPRKSTPCMPRP